VIARPQRCHAGADFHHDPCPLVAEDRGEYALGVSARQGKFVGMADTGGLDFDQHLAGARAFDIDGFQAERLARLASDRGTCLHGITSLVEKSRLGAMADRTQL